MEKPESRARVLALAGLFVLITIGLTIWIGITTREQDSATLTAKRGAASQDDLTPVPQADGMRSTTVAPTAEPTQSAAGGALTIHCIDEVTQKDLPGLRWVAGVEADERAMLASGTTDASGRAVLHDPPAGKLVIFTLRSPPHAMAFTAVNWTRGENRTIEVHVGAGARVKGRVVDDLAAPVGDAEVLVNDDYAVPFSQPEDSTTSSKVAAHTDAAGAYEVDCVASRPSEVWIADGKVHIDRMNDVVVAARKAGVAGAITTPVVPNETKVVRDIVLSRQSTWRGRVVDPNGRGVEGVLLTTNMRRIGKLRHAMGRADVDLLLPGATGFVLLPGETLTGSNGEFEVRNGSRFFMPQLVTRAGTTQAVSLPTLEPGKSVDGLVITLKDAPSFVLDLVDEQGAPARVPNPRIFATSNPVSYGAPRFEPLRLVVSMSDDDARRADIHDDGAGGFIAQIDSRIEDARSYSLWASGWSHANGSITTPLTSGGKLRIVLEDAPCVRVHVRMHDLPRATSTHDVPFVRIEVCLLPPDIKAKDKTGCCGLGSDTGIDLVPGERDLLFPVEARRPFHVYTMVYANGIEWPVVDRGMGAPGGAAVAIDLDASDLPAPSAVKPAEKDAPGTAKKMGSVRATIVDAADGTPLKEVGLDLKWQDRDVTVGLRSAGPSIGELLDDHVPVGEWNGTVRCLGYRNRTDLHVNVREGETTDLGRIVLEPAPRARFVILESDGTRVPKFGAGVRFWDVGMRTMFGSAFIDKQDGVAMLYGDVPEELLVQVVEDFPAMQFVRVQREPDETTVPLSPWRVVDLRVAGIALTLPGASLRVQVRREERDQGDSKVAPALTRWLDCWPKELETPDGTPRVFRCRLGPGSYAVSGDCPLFKLVARSFEVTSGEGPLHVDVDSTE